VGWGESVRERRAYSWLSKEGVMSDVDDDRRQNASAPLVVGILVLRSPVSGCRR
jgi:hypothetical protein